MKIRVPRPEDPELARLWDEAKRAVEERSGADIVALAREHNLITADELPVVLAAINRDPDCCVGDRSRCRCQPQGGWSAEDETGGEG